MTPGQGQFKPHGHNLNNLYRESLDNECYTPNIEALGLSVSYKKIFKVFKNKILSDAMATRVLHGYYNFERGSTKDNSYLV